MSSHGRSRNTPLLRWLNMAVRGLHLAAVIGLGAALLGAPLSAQGQSHGVLVSGFALFALDLWGKPRLLLEWSGASLLLKLAAVAAMAFSAEWRLPLFWGVVLWSALFAHAPASFRHGVWLRLPSPSGGGAGAARDLADVVGQPSRLAGSSIREGTRVE
jgi:hypothetical protein